MAYQWKKWTSAEEEKIVQEKLLDRAFLVEKLQKTPKNTIESAYLKSEYKNKGYGNSLDAASLSGLATKGWDPSACQPMEAIWRGRNLSKILEQAPPT